MEQIYTTAPVQFFTATIYKWHSALDNDKHKDIIIESLQFLTDRKRMHRRQKVSLMAASLKCKFIINFKHTFSLLQTLPALAA